MGKRETGILLRTLRQSAGLSQEYVSGKLGVSRTTYTAFEAGRSEIGLTAIQNLADLYEVSPGEIIDGKLASSSEFEAASIAALPEPLEPEIAPREVNPKLNIKKLQNVLLYIIGNVGARPNVGETVLYKLLYFIDFDYYEKNGRSITGLSYTKNHYGPTPVHEFSHITQSMVNAGELEIIETPHFVHTQKKYLPIKQADLSVLSADEIKHIDAELERLANKSAAMLSELSHKDMPWIASKSGKRIDYQLAMYRTSGTSVRNHEDDL